MFDEREKKKKKRERTRNPTREGAGCEREGAKWTKRPMRATSETREAVWLARYLALSRRAAGSYMYSLRMNGGQRYRICMFIGKLGPSLGRCLRRWALGTGPYPLRLGELRATPGPPER